MTTMKLFSFLVLLSIFFSISACSGINPQATATATQPADSPLVEENTVSASGEVVPQQWVRLSFPAGGQNLKVLVAPGQEVRQGVVLARVDQLAAMAAKDSASAQLAAAKAQLASANAQLASAKATLELLKDKSAADRDITSAEAAVTAAEAAVSASDASIVAATSNLDAADQALINTIIYSPFKGTIVEVNGNDGETISPAQPVIEMADFSTVQMKTTDMSEVDVARVSLGDPATVSFDALPGESISAKVVQIALKKSAGSGVYYSVTLSLDTIPEQLRWGMSAFVVITVK